MLLPEPNLAIRYFQHAGRFLSIHRIDDFSEAEHYQAIYDDMVGMIARRVWMSDTAAWILRWSAAPSTCL
jgi:hypothetical protein